MAEDLVLDTAIRDWVLIPLSVVMVILRARNLRAGANFIPAKSFRARRVYFSNEENGLLYVPKGQAQNPQAQMFSDPNMAMDMMKKNLSMIIPQTLTFAWVNFFFSGFVAAKIPFPLTQRFRSMLQNGIDLSTVDVSYVSSRSWYFLNLFGLRGLFSLILGEENATDDTQRMMQMSGFGFDPSKAINKIMPTKHLTLYHQLFGGSICHEWELQVPLGQGDGEVEAATCSHSPLVSLGAEKDGLDILQHEWALPKFEQRAETVLRNLVR
ncbi:hypothetical protein Pint_09524 [Pistacia integerrima]|uniref:Uncharacterized protein n=1 Tax=Pistacia integerrima TaxID=434235 RepID=A0ACC0XHF2_9ROSI|nr:hypothetical protein Pint_09524 [Pistacia integerrima]